jgi:hypothetical protein
MKACHLDLQATIITDFWPVEEFPEAYLQRSTKTMFRRDVSMYDLVRSSGPEGQN